jgi:5S rRNA maturation endonuclease (ribonuclease M5)
MKKELVLNLMKSLGMHDPLPVNGWWMAQCPLAPFTHSKGKDTRPSFGMNMESANYNCFTCGSGSATKLVMSLDLYSKDDPILSARYHFKQAYEVLQGIEDYLEPLPEFGAITPNMLEFTPWPEWWLEQYQPWHQSTTAKWYLHEGRPAAGSQGIPAEIAIQFELRYDYKYNRIVCPYRTYTGKLAGARGRACDPNATLKHFDYTHDKINNAHGVWYNEQALELAARHHKPVIVVEGQFDCMSVARIYPYVVAGLTAKSSAEKITKLQGCDGVVTMLDNDETGESAHIRYETLLRKHVPIGRVSYPKEYKDPGSLPLEVLEKVLSDLI